MSLAPSQLLMLLQWTDSAFPTGAFAHSGGLETYTQNDMVRTADELAKLIEVRLESAVTTDMIVVHSAISAHVAKDHSQITQLDKLCSASKLAREVRETSEKIGRRMLSSVLNLMSDEILDFYQTEIAAGRAAGHHALTHGLACAALSLEPREALLMFGYTLAANQTAASLKLMSMGQTQAQAILGGAHKAITDATEKALSNTLKDFGSFTPGLDVRAMQHEHLFRRFFIS